MDVDEVGQKRLATRFAKLESRNAAAAQGADEALMRVIAVARRDTGQSRILRGLLLSLYHSTAFPFPMTDLRGLDASLIDDALAVIRADAIGAWDQQIHQVAGEAALFKQWQDLAIAVIE